MKKTVITLSLCASVMLQAQTNEATIAPVTITSATKSEQSIQDVTSNVEVITGAELEAKKIKTLTQALRMKGIPVAQSGGKGQQSSFFLRGFSTANTLVLIDGVNFADPTTPSGKSMIEYLTISDIEQIEIIKGPQSGIWGADAVAGVINIITKKATKDLQVNLNVEQASNDTQSYNFSVAQKIDKFSYYLGANYFETDGISAMTPNGKDPKEYEKDGYRNKTFMAKLGYEIDDKNALNFLIKNIDAVAKYDFGSANDTTSQNKYKSKIYDSSFTHFFTQDISAKLEYQRIDSKREIATFVSKAKSNKYTLSTQIDYLQNSFLRLGTEKKKVKDKQNSNSLENEAYFLTNSTGWNNFIFTQSLRHDEFDNFEDKTTAKVGLKYFINKDIRVSANYGTAYKTPTFSQLYGFGGDENLKPESTKGYEIMAQYKGFSLTYYKNKTKDLIQSDPMWQLYQSEGESTFKGYEARYENEVYDNLLLGLSYNRVFAKDSDGNYLQRRARSTAGVSLDYYGFSKTHLGVYANYVGTRYDELAQTNQTGRYTLVDAVVDYDVTKNVSTYLKIENATDKRYQEVYGYGTPGRVFKVGLNAKF